MKKEYYTTEDSKTTYIISKEKDFEFVNPIEKISNLHIQTNVGLMNLMPLPAFISEEIKDRVFYKKAKEEWEEYYKEMMALSLPENLLKLLESTSKKEQVKLLKGLSLTTDELSSFIIKAHLNGYLYSHYTSHFFPNGTDEGSLPKLAHIEETGELTTIGETTLNEAQVKKLVSERTVKVAKFLDRGENWHCFFLTYRSLRGEENHNGGQPHLHYISDKWTIPREYVLSQMKSKDYNLPSLPHIDFHTDRNPRDNS